jgi:hypothetical protein
MFVKKLVLGAVAAAMPLTALAAAPASAAQGGYRDHDPYVNVSTYYGHYGPKVKVEYKCYTERNRHDDGHGGYGRDRDRDKYGSLTVYYRGYDDRYRVKCDGYPHWRAFDDVRGHGEFRAVLKDADGDRAYDSAYVNNDHDDHGDDY